MGETLRKPTQTPLRPPQNPHGLIEMRTRDPSARLSRTQIYEGHPESKERLRIQSVHLFCCSRSLVSDVEYDVEKLLNQLHVGACHVVSAQIAVAVAVTIENPADCEVRSVVFCRPMRS